MASELPSVLPFDPDAEGLPDHLPLPPEDGGEVILLLADPATRESGWGPRAAVSLARGWARSNRRILLMDGDLVEPTLHRVLGVENGEGVTDGVLYGVSPARMAHPSEDGFLFAPSGTVVADPGSVLRHPRWSSVLAACREAGSVVVLYLPAGAPGVDHLAEEGDRVLRLRTALSAEGASEPGVTVLHPARRQGRARAQAPAAEDATTRGRSGAGEVATEREAGEAVPGSGAKKRAKSPGTPTGARSRSSSRREEEESGRRAGLLLLGLAVLVGGVLAAAFLGYLQIPGVTPESAPQLSLLRGR